MQHTGRYSFRIQEPHRSNARQLQDFTAVLATEGVILPLCFQKVWQWQGIHTNGIKVTPLILPFSTQRVCPFVSGPVCAERDPGVAWFLESAFLPVDFLPAVNGGGHGVLKLNVTM